jgi:hypothetical protein
MAEVVTNIFRLQGYKLHTCIAQSIWLGYVSAVHRYDLNLKRSSYWG